MAAFTRAATALAGCRAIHRTDRVTVAADCGVLSAPSTLCPDIIYATNVTDAKEVDKTIKVLLDKISREGLESTGADCFLSIRRSLCLTHYRKCNADAGGKLVPVCESVRKQTLEVCGKGGVFADTSVIKAHLDESAFAESNDCVAVAAGAKVSDAKANSNATDTATATTSTKPGSATSTASATPTKKTVRTCTLDDMHTAYEDHCAKRQIRLVLMRKKSEVSCEDRDGLTKRQRTTKCACPADRLRTYTSQCSTEGRRAIIAYQPDLSVQQCDRHLSVPVPRNETCDAKSANSWMPQDVRLDFRGMNWAMHTGCAPSRCFEGSDPEKHVKDPECLTPPANCTGWNLSENGAHSPSLAANLTSYLEFAVSSLNTAKNPSLLFTFSAQTDRAVTSGLRVMLDGRERMTMIGDQNATAGYEVAMVPGFMHYIRWEWIGDGQASTHASIHAFVLRELVAEINTHPMAPRPKNTPVSSLTSTATATSLSTALATSSAATTATTTATTMATTVTAATASASPKPSIEAAKPSSNTEELPGTDAVVTLNSTQLTANINHQPVRRPSTNATTAQKPQSPFTIPDANNATATATIDEVAVSRRFSGGVFVTVLFIAGGVGLSALFLWRRRMGRPNDHALGRWLKRRYALVPSNVHGLGVGGSGMSGKLEDD
ncbi:hypothetical protein THASP1DRAFT_33157, partial [Thamnocephalis sphaerospora]